jgi:hypothetical protein
VLPLIASNAIWASEIIFAVLIAVRRTRRIGVLAAVIAVLVVHLVARQPMYALLLVQLLLLCVPGQWNRRLMWLFAAAYLVVFVAALGVLSPELVLREGRL